MTVTAGSLQKMTTLLADSRLATALSVGGYETPRQIKAASDQELEAVEGVDSNDVATLRALFPVPD
jgi:hypothetical protein